MILTHKHTDICGLLVRFKTTAAAALLPAIKIFLLVLRLITQTHADLLKKGVSLIFSVVSPRRLKTKEKQLKENKKHISGK